MILRSGNWWNRKRILYYSDRPEKTADRPHRYTIYLGILSPVVAFAALLFAVQSYRISSESLRTSQRSLEVSQTTAKVGQRAYLAIILGSFFSARSTDPDLNNTVGLNESFRIENSGNTPAHVIGIAYDYSVPRGWRFRQKLLHNDVPINVGAKSMIVGFNTDLFDLTDEATILTLPYKGKQANILS